MPVAKTQLQVNEVNSLLVALVGHAGQIEQLHIRRKANGIFVANLKTNGKIKMQMPAEPVDETQTT